MKIDKHPELYPTTIRAYAKIKFKEPIPEKKGGVCTYESIQLTVDARSINIDFDEVSICVDKTDRSIVEVLWKNPDWEAFPKEFDLLTFDVLNNSKVKLDDDLSNVVCASKEGYPLDDDAVIVDIDHIIDMALVSPYDEFEDVVLVEDGVVL